MANAEGNKSLAKKLRKQIRKHPLYIKQVHLPKAKTASEHLAKSTEVLKKAKKVTGIKGGKKDNKAPKPTK